MNNFTNTLLVVVQNHIINYPTPISISFLWNFGFLAGICLIIQMVSGIFLSMHYCSDMSSAFQSVEYIMRQVNYGWLVRYTHSNGASIFLFTVYVHMASALYFNSYFGTKTNVWISGVIILYLLMATAFLGYVLPWGQMSFWGATVITNLVSTVPFFGQTITYWLWGGFAIDSPTIVRFFVLHFIIPFVILGLVILHIYFLHEGGSGSGSLYINVATDYVSFYPYFVLKDFFSLSILLCILSYLVFFEPNLLGHPDNYVKANPLSTPAHIVPEWYFLPFYTMLRAVPSNTGGVVYMFGALVVLLILPFGKSNSPCTSNFFFNNIPLSWNASLSNLKILKFAHSFIFVSNGRTLIYDCIFFLWISVILLLGWLGAQPVEKPFWACGAHLSIGYFLFFFLSFFMGSGNF